VPEFSDLIRQNAATAWLFVPSAILLGALHGLEPGHSKTMMAAFIVAVRGTITQAVLLAISATVSHTAIVWIVALLALTYGKHWSAETSEPYFQILSGVIIVAIAVWILYRTWRDQQRARVAAQSHRHDRGHTQDETKRIDTGHGVMQLSIFEDGVPPRFRLHYIGKQGQPLAPRADEIVSVETVRDDGRRAVFGFVNQGEYLESTDEIPEPHQFTATLTIAHGGHAHTFETHYVEHGHAHPHPHEHEHPYKHAHPHTHSHDESHAHEHGHDHGHKHGHSHARAAEHSHDHAGLSTSDPNYEDAHQRAHAREIKQRFTSGTATSGQVILFGLTGGLLPCPAAVTVLLLCLQLQRFWLGIVLVLCFSIGLALTLMASGILAAWGTRHVVRRWKGFDAFSRRAPYLASVLIICVGLYVGIRGVMSL
jgi:nickel/cobalt transporter (NicO) family protein